MQDFQRKIHKLRIISQAENILPSAVTALQDAFNIASFPGLPPNGLLLIKKFDLGIFKSHSTSMAISRLIDNKIQAISYQSVCVDEQEYPKRNVVWFSDPAQAVFSFIKLIIKQDQPQAWYWSVLFPSWRANMNLAEVMLVLTKDIKQQEIKPYVMAGVIQQLLAERQLDKILAATTSQLAQHLLSDAGIYPHVITAIPDERVQLREIFFYMQADWQVLVSKAIVKWGKEDVRTLWLTFSALIKHNPALCVNRQLLTFIIVVIDDIKNDYSLFIEDEVKNDFPLFVEPGSTIKCIEDKPLYVHQQADLENEINSSRNAMYDEIENITNEQTCKTSLDYSGFVYSDYCGLAFLISLLDLLSISKLLLLNPLLAELNFPARIILAIAQRFCISNKHPVLQSLPKSHEVNNEIVENYISPANWKSLIVLPQVENNILYLFKTEGYDDACFITDRTKKLFLYVGKSDKQRFPAWMRSFEIKDQAGVYFPAKLKDLENTIQLLCSRYLYRYAQTGLRQLLNRKGHIAITKTHIDILFDNKQIDHRIRYAGLDINPGWIFWLARVVQFHYYSEDHANARKLT